jgi:hypothetical protein
MKRANNVHLSPTGSFAQEGILWCLQKVLLIQASMKVITWSIFRIQALNQCYSQRLLDQTLAFQEISGPVILDYAYFLTTFLSLLAPNFFHFEY